MRTICIFTGTRAEYGLLKPVMKEVSARTDLHLQIMASGTHLSPEFGMTIREIENDGLKVDEKVEVLLSSDTPIGICKSMGLGLIGYSEALARLAPDILLILGDRFEAFTVAGAAMVSRIPVAHLHGGEATQGLIDEPMRHSITKMSHLHFTSCEEYRQRVIQLGEHPDRVFNVGALGVENFRQTPLMSRDELAEFLGRDVPQRLFMVTFHPVTLEDATAGQQMEALCRALDHFPEFGVLFTYANSDTDGRIINRIIEDYVADNPERSFAFPSLGLKRYASFMRLAEAVIGNSSSGLIETPVFKIPTVNIGDRQKGRVRAASVIDCAAEDESIISAITHAIGPDFKASMEGMVHPLAQDDTSTRIVDILAQADLLDILKKTFYDCSIDRKELHNDGV